MQTPNKSKYPDNDPHLAEAVRYLAFRRIVVMDDNPQTTFAHGHLISFDYGFAFNLTEEMFNALMLGNRKALRLALSNFKSNLNIEKGYWISIELLRRPNTDFLLDAYLDPIMEFPDVDFDPLINELSQAFPKTVVDYSCCLQLVKKQITEMIEKEP